METSSVPTLEKGQLFSSRQQCRNFVQDLALAQGKRALVDKSQSSGRNVVFCCSSTTPCTFEVRAFKSRKQNVHGFVVSSFNLEHNGCSGSAKVTGRQVAELAVAQQAVNANRKVSSRALQHQIKAATAIEVPSRMTYRARDEIIATAVGDYIAAFKRLPSLLEEFCTRNPTSHYSLERNEKGQFERAFLSHPFISRHQQYGQVILGIDGSYMRHQVYREVMLVLVGRDGANHNITLAVALCAEEDGRNCSWFLDNCKRAGVKFDGIPIFTDRGKGLCSALKASTPDAIVRYCTRHILGNIKATFRGNIPTDIESVLYRVQAAETSDEYKSVLATLALTHPAVAAYIEAIDPERWTMHPASVKKVKMYGWYTTSFVESTNGAAIPARSQFPFEFFQGFMIKFMDNAFNTQKTGEKWLSEGRVLSPYAKKMIQEQQEQNGYYEAIDPERWTMHPASVKKVKMYGWYTTSFVESTNGAAIPARSQFPFEFFQGFMIKFMDNAFNTQKTGEKWLSEGRVLSPYAKKMIQEQQEQNGYYEVHPSAPGKAFVRDTRGVHAQYRVNITERSCTCSYIAQHGLPCRHYIAALTKFKSLDQIYSACDGCYLVENYVKGYGCGSDGGIDMVLESELKETEVLAPSRDLTGAGRKRTKRIASQGEIPSASTTKATRSCATCGQKGHNRRTCQYS